MTVCFHQSCSFFVCFWWHGASIFLLEALIIAHFAYMNLTKDTFLQNSTTPTHDSASTGLLEAFLGHSLFILSSTWPSRLLALCMSSVWYFGLCCLFPYQVILFHTRRECLNRRHKQRAACLSQWTLTLSGLCSVQSTGDAPLRCLFTLTDAWQCTLGIEDIKLGRLPCLFEFNDGKILVNDGFHGQFSFSWSVWGFHNTK